ncbi:hypothetical protein ACU8V7_16090 [Zobellia nedashkovskayae]
MKNNDIYFGKTDSINQFRWTKEDTLYTGILKYNQEFGIDMMKMIRMDSLPYYQSLDSMELQSESLTNMIMINKLKWINIDKIVTPDYLLDFDVVVENTGMDNFTCYFIYENQDSFMSEHRTINDLNFKNIPIKNKTNIVLVGKVGNKFLAKKNGIG